MDTESRMWLPGRRGLGKGKMGKGDQLYDDGCKLNF